MKINIVYHAASDASGYAQCAKDYIFALDNNPLFNVRFKPFTFCDNIDGAGVDYDTIKRLKQAAGRVIDAPYVNLCHSIPDRFIMDSKALLNIGYTVTEAETIPPHWVFICNRMDALFTCSEFCKRIFVKNGITVPIFVVPHCHDPKTFITDEKYNIVNLKSFNFLFMADLTPRKGYRELIRAYCEEFGKDDDVSLTMKVYSQGFSTAQKEECRRRIKQYARSLNYEINFNTPPVLFYGDCLPNNCVPRFINTFDCVVSPHCAEGWGLVCSQAMLLGKLVIATEYGGNMDYMKDCKNCLLVPIGSIQKVDDEMVSLNSNYAGAVWPTASVEKLRLSMRFAFNSRGIVGERDINGKLGNNAQNDIKTKYNYETISSLIHTHLAGLINEKNKHNLADLQQHQLA